MQVSLAARRRSLALGWADRAVRARAASALVQAGRVDDARALATLPPLADDTTLDAARRTLAAVLLAVLSAPVADDVVQVLFAAGEAVAMATAVEPQPQQMRELVQALHFSARYA